MCDWLFKGMLLLLLYTYSSTRTKAEFAEVPSSVVVELGVAIPPYRCRHTAQEATINWLVNGSSAGRFPDIRSGSVNESGNIVHTLTIPTEPQYNGTEVVCLAAFTISDFEVTPIATIFFSVANPPTMVPANFDLVPSPLTVAVEQGTATFQCQHPLANNIDWLVNGVTLNKASLSNISVNIQFKGSGVITHTLLIGTLLEYNKATIECVGTFSDGSPSQVTEPVRLLIQDTPEMVSNASCKRDYTSNTLVTLWSPLPTLDINGTDPDIVYAVQLFKTTCGQNTLIYQTIEGGRNVTKELDLMQTYKAVITARNNVREARNGPSVEMEERFTLLNGSTLFHLARNSQVIITSLDPFPSFYVIKLDSLDGHGSNLVINVTVHQSNEILSVIMEDMLPSKSLWNASILAYGCEANNHATVTELSTHDLQNVTVNSPLPSELRVTGDFFYGSTATGVLLIIYSLNSDSDTYYIANERKQENIFDVRVNGLPGAQYGVSVFSMENQLPFPRVVASPKIVAIADADNQEMTQQWFVEYCLQATSTGVCITCTFLDSFTTDCLVVVHQPISSNGLMNIVSSHKFTRSGDTAYGCIEGVNLEQYQIGVPDGKMIMEPNSMGKKYTPVGAIVAGIVLGVLVFSVIAVVIIVVLILMRLNRRQKAIHVAVESPVVAVNPPIQAEAMGNADDGSPSLEPTLPQEGIQESADKQPLLTPPPPGRVVADGVSTSDVSDESDSQEASVHGRVTGGSPPVLGSEDNGGQPIYAQPVLLRSLNNTVHPPATTEKIVYEDIQKFQNQEGQQYALPQLESTSKKGAVDDLHQVVYVKVKPHSMTQTGDQNIDCTSDRAGNTATCTCTVDPPPVPSRETTITVCEPITTDQLFSFLLPHASKWQSLGLALLLDEDRLDEVFTNNEREEDCLREMLELYMLRSDLDHSWEEVQAALEKRESSSDAPVATSVQEVNSSQNSPVVSGETMLVSDVDADSDHDKQAAVGKELEESNNHKEEEGNSDSGYSSSQQSESESSDNSVVLEMKSDSTSLSQTSSEELPEVSEKNRSMLNPLSENLKADKQEESRDSGNDYSQQSELESSENSVALEMEDDSISLSQAALDERLEASEKNGPILLSGDLEEYESKVDHSFGSQTTLTEDGEFGRPTNEELPMPPSTSINSCSPGLQFERFCEQPEDEGNNDELCKIKPVHCQDSCIHDNYNEALIHQMGLLSNHKVRDELEYNNAAQESSLVHIDSEKELKSLDMDFCTPKTFPGLDIPKVHEFVPRCFSVSPKYSHPLMLTAVQVENDRFVTLHFAGVILSIAYSSKLDAIINVCPVKVCVCCIMNID